MTRLRQGFGGQADTITRGAATTPALPSPSQELMTMSDADQTVEAVNPKAMTLLQALSSVDEGRTAKQLNATFDGLIHELMLLDHNEGIRKSKGTLTVKISVEYEDGTAKLKIEEAVKTPKAPQRANVFWLTGDGRLTPENPRQMTMFRDPPSRRVIVS